MKYKIVLFANQKGGVGKSTLCTFLAHDLTAKDRPVVVADADLQQSLFQLRAMELQQSGKNDEDAPLMLIDDVLTTSATLTACADSMKDIKGITISILTLALAGH